MTLLVREGLLDAYYRVAAFSFSGYTKGPAGSGQELRRQAEVGPNWKAEGARSLSSRFFLFTFKNVYIWNDFIHTCIYIYILV